MRNVGPLQLPDGRWLREVQSFPEKLNPQIAFRVINELVGDDALKFINVTKTAIEENASSGKAAKHLLDAIRKAGGVTYTTTTSIKPTRDRE